MYQIILAYAQSQAAGGCVDPAIFKMTAGSYDPFAAYATQTGQGALWEPWSADEQCDQAGASDDVVIADPNMTAWCSLPAATTGM